MKRYEMTIDGRTFDVEVLSDPKLDRVDVEVDGEVLAVEVRRSEAAAVAAVPAEQRPAPQAARTAPAPAAKSVSPAGSSVRAPLPGVVKQVMVRAGQQVAPGETLLVIEAMKMNNAIRATRAGMIEAVQAVEGRQVAHGDELLRYRS